MALHFVFCLHNHQPVGNFGFVFDNAHGEAYVPFLDTLERHPSQKMVFHFTGVLYRWFEERHPELLDRLAALAAAGRVEILSGGFYEPILAVIPEEDRYGQIRKMSDYISRRFGQEPRGLWLAERVWEPSLPGSLVEAGVRYAVVDDYHLRAAGITDPEITEPCLTGDGDRVMTVIGGSEQLRYYLPYKEPEAAIAFLRELHLKNPEKSQLVAMADDGEKFGVWPGTNRRVYQEAWLERFFSLVEANRDWLVSSTFAEALAAVPAERQVYLPTVSYMELSEWALPPKAARTYGSVKEVLEGREDLGYIRHLIRGGYWRNFLGKYPESRYLLGRMWQLSRRLHRLEGNLPAAVAQESGGVGLENARDELWQSQCNDAYWHGVFGGLYLPFLRAAAYEHLSRCEAVLDRLERGEGDFIALDSADLDGDGREELLVENRSLALALDPGSGSALELDFKPSSINLFNSLTRREETYHSRLLQLRESGAHQGDVRSIHHIERMKEGQDLPEIFYDAFPRRSLVDHLWRRYSLDGWRRGEAAGPWCGKRTYRAVSHREESGRMTILMETGGEPGRLPGRRKTVWVARSGASLGVSVSLEEFDGRQPLFIGQEFNLTPTSVREARVEICGPNQRWDALPFEGGEFRELLQVRIVDGHRAFSILLESPGPVTLWAFPLATISNSEAGFEEIFQQWSLLLWKECSRDECGLEITLSIT